MSKNTGGSAFPFSVSKDTHANSYRDIYSGMTLRDYFAAKAMQGLLANPNVKPETDCARFYAWADAMLAEREKP